MKLLGKAFLFLATMLFLAGVSLFVVGSYLLTWPILRLSPRSQKTQALVNLSVSLFALARAFTPTEPPDGDTQKHPSPPNSAPIQGSPPSIE